MVDEAERSLHDALSVLSQTAKGREPSWEVGAQRC